MLINDNNLVTKSNNLILSKYNLSSEEQKIILTLASTVEPDDKEFKSYEFKIKDFLKLLKIKNQSRYLSIPQITKSLMKKVFEIKEGNKTLQLSWLSSVEYENKAGKITLCFDPKLKPYLLQLSNFFTSYKLSNILKLKSKYSIRLYEILKSNQFKKNMIIKIEDLKEILGITSEYQRYYDFKIRVLEQAKKELYASTDIKFHYDEQREQRKIKSINFYIFKNDNIDIANQIIDEIENIRIEMENVLNRKVNTQILKNTIERHNLSLDDFKPYLKNWQIFNYKTKNDPVGFFLHCVITKRDIPQIENGINKPIQSSNFDQRKYDDEFFESLYDNLKE